MKSKLKWIFIVCLVDKKIIVESLHTINLSYQRRMNKRIIVAESDANKTESGNHSERMSLIEDPKYLKWTDLPVFIPVTSLSLSLASKSSMADFFSKNAAGKCRFSLEWCQVVSTFELNTKLRNSKEWNCL